jgi:cytochrome c oxidase subunit I
VLFGGAIFGLFSGIYYWYPKVTGKLLSERIGKAHFWLMLIGFNLTFAPFHILGLQGMARRYYRYPPHMGFDVWNMVSTIGSFVIAFSILLFIINVIRTQRHGEKAGRDPWDARTIEWSTSSPPPHYNFAEIPVIAERDDWWHKKYTEDERGVAVPVLAGGSNDDEEEEHADVHMPGPSYWPLVAAAGLPLIGWGLIFQFALAAVGGVILLVGLYGWALEPGE